MLSSSFTITKVLHAGCRPHATQIAAVSRRWVSAPVHHVTRARALQSPDEEQPDNSFLQSRWATPGIIQALEVVRSSKLRLDLTDMVNPPSKKYTLIKQIYELVRRLPHGPADTTSSNQSPPPLLKVSMPHLSLHYRFLLLSHVQFVPSFDDQLLLLLLLHDCSFPALASPYLDAMLCRPRRKS